MKLFALCSLGSLKKMINVTSDNNPILLFAGFLPKTDQGIVGDGSCKFFTDGVTQMSKIAPGTKRPVDLHSAVIKC
jgi:hypothetical protein